MAEQEQRSNLFRELRRRNVLRIGAAYLVSAWLIVQVVETIFPVYGLSNDAIRLVITALGVGLVPALILAWVFEITPEGIKRESEVDRSRPAPPGAMRTLDRMIIIVLALALGYFAFDKFALSEQRRQEFVEEAREEGRTEALRTIAPDKSIAVMPFSDLSPDGNQDYLAQGIAEEIIGLLTRIPGLRVISRSSAFAVREQNRTLAEIAEVLNVGYVLEGSVRRFDDRLRVSAQLLDARHDTNVWSETYDRGVEDIFAIQNELARAIAVEMRLDLMGRLPYTRTHSPEAYDLFLRGHYYAEYIDANEAARSLERAVAADPGFTDAWVDLSRAYFQIGMTPDLPAAERKRNVDLSYQAYYRAADIDPEHPVVLTFRAFDQVDQDRDYEAASKIMQRAIESFPDHSDVLRSAMIFARILGRADIAVPLGRRAVTGDPLCSGCNYHYARSLLHAGDYAAAEQEVQRYRSLAPGTPGGETLIGWARLLRGDPQGAREMFEQRKVEGERLYGEILVRIATGSDDGVDADIAQAERLLGDKDPESVLHLHAWRGDRDRAFHWLGIAAREAISTSDGRDLWRLGYMLRHPLLVSLHEDPRWVEWLRRAGIAPEQMAEVEFDPDLAGF